MNFRPGIRGAVALALAVAVYPTLARAADPADPADPAAALPNERPVVDPAHLGVDPDLAAVEPAAIWHPAPGLAERWRDGLADIEARFASDLAALRAQAPESGGKARAGSELLLQARKLDFEIELLRLQIALFPLAEAERAEPADALQAHRDVVESLRASVEILENLRQRILDGGPAVLPATAASGLEE